MSTKQFEGYKMTFRFNASHSMTDKSKSHAHTFLLNLYIRKDVSDFVVFMHYERAILDYLSQYKGKYLNDFFDEIPTLEFLCIRFYKDIRKIFEGINAYSLVSVELGDSPIKSVKVGNEIVASRASIFIENKTFDLSVKGLGIQYNEN